MQASVKCSNCGAEIKNLTFTWGRKQWMWSLVSVPFFCIAFFPLWSLYKPEPEFGKDLQINLLEKRMVENRLEILGTVNNTGKVRWENIRVAAQFFGPDGKFLDEADDSLSSSVEAGASIHFKMTIDEPSEQVLAESTRMELKIGDAFAMRF